MNATNQANPTQPNPPQTTPPPCATEPNTAAPTSPKPTAQTPSPHVRRIARAVRPLPAESTMAAEFYCCSGECAKEVFLRACKGLAKLAFAPKGSALSARRKGLARLTEEEVDAEWKAFKADEGEREEVVWKLKAKEKEEMGKNVGGGGEGGVVIG